MGGTHRVCVTVGARRSEVGVTERETVSRGGRVFSAPGSLTLGSVRAVSQTAGCHTLVLEVGGQGERAETVSIPVASDCDVCKTVVDAVVFKNQYLRRSRLCATTDLLRRTVEPGRSLVDLGVVIY